MSRNEVDHILFGAAYYDEYLMMKGIDRIDEDMNCLLYTSPSPRDA